ncbi:MAG: Flp pilus assembly complex ATPase component TadA [Bdellovibrionaceae bacterium]|nr:Flp pilus assembly complex ATPase component TadA [Pseudobdellovibrionaceae bacterium]
MSKNGLAEIKKSNSSNKLAQIQSAKKPGESITATAERMGIVEEELGEYLSEHYQLPFIELADFEVDGAALSALTSEQCRKHVVLPISKAGNTLVVAFSDPTNLFVRDDIAYVTRCKIEPVVATEKGIRKALDKYYPESQPDAGDILSEIENVDEAEDARNLGMALEDSDAPVVKFVNVMLGEAVKDGVSDIHVEPYEKAVRVRFRKDGQLIEKYKPPVSIGAAISSRIKVLAKMDLAERRKPQDGRIKLRFKDKGDVDFRVNVLPVVDGEKVVLRILDKSKVQNIKLSELGFDDGQLAMLSAAIQKPQGLILVTGPTGSGKTTTLYASLQEIHDPTINISTAEDPVEFKLQGINQTQVHPDIGYTFAEALRAFLRQDPDVILVGEIRDSETAEISFKASSTGHLVLSTLHTNDAPGTVSRLIEMGVPTYMITSTVELILAQRLLGRICPSCKKEDKVDISVMSRLNLKEKDVDGVKFYKGTGCETCSGTGIKGRVAVYEFMIMSDVLKDAVGKAATPIELKKAALRGGMKSLRMSAIEKAKAGVISLTEVLNGTMQDPIL